ncbi:MAG TPA: Gfo/Idh/MocA family oxidoreductase, partial [Bryobacteraceae bacterium]|nr:Gfo/Idh/MocA family oxidoreductase [Bryobacteraceae bacterium]
MARSKESKVRYAVIGLGDIVQEAVLPGFHHCDHSRVVAFVSGDPEKHRALGARYGVSLHYHYNQLEECLAGNDIDAVYIGLPNHLHREYAVRCAAGKKHVLCEKPMAVNASECRDMIDAARANKVKLMIAYRLHFEEGNLEAIRLAQSGEIGEPRYFSSAFSQQVRDGNVRLAYGSEEGGGPVFDMGVYCINAARYLFREEPVEISAMTANDGEPRFARTEEMATIA